MEPSVLRCGGKPCRWRYPEQTSPLGFGRRLELTVKKKMTRETGQEGWINMSSKDLLKDSGINMDRGASNHSLAGTVAGVVLNGVFTPRKPLLLQPLARIPSVSNLKIALLK